MKRELKFRQLFATTLAACFALLVVSCGDGSSSSTDSAQGGTGTGGSTARMTISGDYLYAISNSDIQLFNITTPSSPNPWSRVSVSWGIETLFPYNDYLLIGAVDGLHIMDNTDPASPQYITDFPHANARDPVVAADGYAYVTLRDDPDSFSTGVNQLNVIDIASITSPVLIDTIPMQHPSGLSVNDSLLFVCDDVAGLKVFDTTDPANLQVRDYLPNVVCNDVIAQDNTLYVITNNSMLQYDYSTLPPQLISEVKEGA